MYKYKISIIVSIILSIFSFPLLSMETETEFLNPQIIKKEEGNLTSYSYKDNKISAQATFKEAPTRERIIQGEWNAKLENFEQHKSQEYKNTKSAQFIFDALGLLSNPESTAKFNGMINEYRTDLGFFIKDEKPDLNESVILRKTLIKKKIFPTDESKEDIEYMKTWKPRMRFTQSFALPEDKQFIFEVFAKLIPAVKKITYNVIQ